MSFQVQPALGMGLQQERMGLLSLNQMELIVGLNNHGVSKIHSSEFQEAGKCLQRALEKVREGTFFTLPHAQHGFQSTEVSKSLYIYQRGEYDEGMHVYSDPILLESHVSSLHDAIATILFNLGQLFLRLNDNDEAFQAFSRALQIAKWGDNCTTKAKQQSVTVLAILHNIGHVQYRAGHYEDAVRTYIKALDLGKSKFNKTTHNMLEVSTTLNCLGVLYFHLPKADTEKAMEFYVESLAIRRAVLGADCQCKEVATTLNNIGRIHYMRGEHDKALELYRDALTMRRHLFGNDHLDVAATIYNAGQTHHQRGELDEAMHLYDEFLTIARQRLGVHHRDVAIMLKCMAQIYHERKDYDNATKLYEEALVVGRAALGNCHPEVASTLNKLGNLLYEKGDFDRAIQIYQEGLISSAE